MKGFYQVTETIKNQLLADVNVNTVTTGDITRIDLSKQTMFPLSHIIVNNVGNEDNILRFSLSVLSMDVVNISKEEVVDIFIGNNNEQDILNTQLAVLNKLVQVLRGGTLHQDLYGDVYFPMQTVLFLNEPDKDFTGGEFVLTQQTPRAQSKAIVLKPKKASMINTITPDRYNVLVRFQFFFSILLSIPSCFMVII